MYYNVVYVLSNMCCQCYKSCICYICCMCYMCYLCGYILAL